MRHEEKRQARRKQTNYVVEFYDVQGLLIGVGQVLNLSAVGALVSSSVRLTTGQKVQIRLRRGDRWELELTSTVVRVRGKGASLTYGLKFSRDTSH